MNELRQIFPDIPQLYSISVQLLRIEKDENPIRYFSREIELKPEEDFFEYLKELCAKYSSQKTSSLQGEVDIYQGDVIIDRVYKLPVTDELISDSLQVLESVIADPDTEGDVVGQEWNALLIKGLISGKDGTVPVRLITMKSPIAVLRNRFLLDEKGQFRKIENRVLTLNKSLDAVIYGETFYFLTLQAENLFNIERAYKKKSEKKTTEIIESGIISDPEKFQIAARKGVNPRRFVSFNPQRFEALQQMTGRKRFAELFQLKLASDGTISTDDAVTTDRLIRFLCDKAMVDPVDEAPREVSAAKVWK